MIDTISDASAKILELLESWSAFIGTNPRVAAGIVVGLLVSWGGTQAVKRLTMWQGRRLTILAIALAFVVCFTMATLGILWPFPWAELWISAAVGLFAPLAYKWTRALLADRFPKIEKLSSRYSLIDRTPPRND